MARSGFLTRSSSSKVESIQAHPRSHLIMSDPNTRIHHSSRQGGGKPGKIENQGTLERHPQGLVSWKTTRRLPLSGSTSATATIGKPAVARSCWASATSLRRNRRVRGGRRRQGTLLSDRKPGGGDLARPASKPPTSTSFGYNSQLAFNATHGKTESPFSYGIFVRSPGLLAAAVSHSQTGCRIDC